MNVNEINAYLQRAGEIIGDRSQAEIDYDNAVIAHFSKGKDIKKAIQAANLEHPKEALKPGPDHWSDLAARYDYIMEHKAILKRLGMKERANKPDAANPAIASLFQPRIIGAGSLIRDVLLNHGSAC